MKTLNDYRLEIQGFRLSAVKLTATGRFLAYSENFLVWFAELNAVLRNSSKKADDLLEYAYGLILEENDDLFEEILSNIEDAVDEIDYAAMMIDKGKFERFAELCKIAGKDPLKLRINLWPNTLEGNISVKLQETD